MRKGMDTEIQEWINEYHEHKNPVFDKERWCKISWPTLFALQKNLEPKLEDFEDNIPLDEEWNLCVEWFWDFRTGEIKKDMFKIIDTFDLGKKTYKTIYIPWSHVQFVVDFENRKSFPWLEKWAPRSIKSVDSFWDKEIVIYWWYDDIICLDNDGKQIWDTCVDIKKIKYWNIDILEFKSRINPDYDVNDLRTKVSYLWSDGKQYKPKYQQINDVGVASFEEISNIINAKKKIINVYI